MKLSTSMHNHCHRHLSSTFHAVIHHIDTLEHGLLVFAIIISFVSNAMFAGNTLTIPQETLELIYPLQKITTLPCRQQIKSREELDDSCKIDLPIIKGANYSYYRDKDAYKNTSFTSLYTVLRGATYTNQRDIEKGDHAGVDISSAKGTPLYAVAHGIVTFAGQQAGYGNVVKLMFRHQGMTYHAVYGHMDTILVKKGDTLVQGQAIGTIGNSGSTYGALGGYHVHFEINRDNKGYPLFYYDKCPALVVDKKSFTEITENGLCRAYREKAQVDPIVFIENSKGKTLASTVVVPRVDTKNIVLVKDTSPQIPRFVTLRKMDPSKLSQDAILFVKERDIQLIATYNDKMKLGEQGTLQLFVTKKGSASPFQGNLPSSFTIISPSDGIRSSVNSISYVDKGTETVSLHTLKTGIQKIAVSLGGQTIAVLEIEIY